ncbi:hypothetical protein H1R20_g4145, partial [Candolleomyces eurysporus]
MAITYPDAAFIGALLSQLFMGVYITVFGLYIKLLRVRKTPFAAVDYGLVTLFVLCLATIVLDAVQQFFTLMRGGAPWTARVNAATSSMSLTLDFISQIILIYRCWHVWGRNLLIGIPPSIVALTSYASQVAGLCVTIDFASVSDSFRAVAKDWWVPLGLASMSLSLVVNAVVSALMITRIYLVYRETKSASDSAGTRLSWVASILLESAIALFFAQLVYLVLYKLEHPAFSLVAGPVTIIYGLNCTAIMVRVGMNRSYETVSTTRQQGQGSSLMFGVHKGEKSSPVSELSNSTQLSTGLENQRKGRFRQYNETETTIV